MDDRLLKALRVISEECKKHDLCSNDCAFYDGEAWPRYTCTLHREPYEWAGIKTRRANNERLRK